MLDKTYREGVAQPAPLVLSYDAWLFFRQLPELIDLAKSFADTTIVVNHCAGVVDKGSYSFATGWNAFKRLTAGVTATERQALFEGTVGRVYRLG